MGRLITFAVGVLIGVVLKWQYDQQQSTGTPPSQTTGWTATPSPSSAADIQEIAITVQESHRVVTTPPAQPSENRASPPDVA